MYTVLAAQLWLQRIEIDNWLELKTETDGIYYIAYIFKANVSYGFTATLWSPIKPLNTHLCVSTLHS